MRSTVSVCEYTSTTATYTLLLPSKVYPVPTGDLIPAFVIYQYSFPESVPLLCPGAVHWFILLWNSSGRPHTFPGGRLYLVGVWSWCLRLNFLHNRAASRHAFTAFCALTRIYSSCSLPGNCMVIFYIILIMGVALVRRFVCEILFDICSVETVI